MNLYDTDPINSLAFTYVRRFIFLSCYVTASAANGPHRPMKVLIVSEIYLSMPLLS